MTEYDYSFLYKGKSTILKNDDIAKVDIAVKTVAFIRNNERIYTEFGDDKIYIESINEVNSSEIIQKISKLTPVLNTNDSNGVLIFKLSGKSE